MNLAVSSIVKEKKITFKLFSIVGSIECQNMKMKSIKITQKNENKVSSFSFEFPVTQTFHSFIVPFESDINYALQ